LDDCDGGCRSRCEAIRYLFNRSCLVKRLPSRFLCQRPTVNWTEDLGRLVIRRNATGKWDVSCPCNARCYCRFDSLNREWTVSPLLSQSLTRHGRHYENTDRR
jgi:hypothetical protein